MSHTKQTPILEYTDAELQSLTVPAGTITHNTTLSCLSYYTGQEWINSDDWESTYDTVSALSASWSEGASTGVILSASSSVNNAALIAKTYSTGYTNIDNEHPGNVRGDYAVDLQMDRHPVAATGAPQVAAGTGSVIIGGAQNTISTGLDGLYASVLGGGGNEIGVARYGVVIGGASNFIGGKPLDGGTDNAHHSIACGRNTVAKHHDVFIYGSLETLFESKQINTFNINASNGLRLVHDTDDHTGEVLTCLDADGHGKWQALSADEWNSTYTTVSTNSASWADHFDSSLIEAESANWDSTYTTVSAESANWIGGDYDDSALQAASGDWNSTYTTTSANSALWSAGGSTAIVYEPGYNLGVIDNDWPAVVTKHPSGYSDIDTPTPNDRGIGAVDLQVSRQNADQVAGGDHSFILGGKNNKINYLGVNSTLNYYSGIVGGQSNEVRYGEHSIILGGQNNVMDRVAADSNRYSKHSIACGRDCLVYHNNTFSFNDTATTFETKQTNTFNIHASNGLRLVFDSSPQVGQVLTCLDADGHGKWQSLSADEWNSTYTTVSTESANWDSTYDTVSSLSASWQEGASTGVVFAPVEPTQVQTGNWASLIVKEGNTGYTSTDTIPAGNDRGQHAVDLQINRTSANQIAGGNNSSILGGSANLIASYSGAGAAWSTIAGGNRNEIFGQYSSIVGGSENKIGDGVTLFPTHSFAAGYRARANHNYSFIWSDTGTSFSTVSANTFNIHASNGLRFVHDGNDHTGEVLTCLDADGHGKWQPLSADEWNSTYTTVQADSATWGVVAGTELNHDNNPNSTYAALEIKERIGTAFTSHNNSIVQGNLRGATAVDLQMYRTSADQVAAGPRSALLGGGENKITTSGNYSVITNGFKNEISSNYSTILGGRNNIVISERSIVGGQYSKAAHDDTFVFNTNPDGISNEFSSLSAKTFNIRVDNGLRLVHDGNDHTGEVLTCLDADGHGKWQPLVTTAAVNTSTYTQEANKSHILYDTTSNSITTTLLAPASHTGEITHMITGGTNSVTLSSNTAATINGAQDVTFTGTYNSVKVFTDGTNFYAMTGLSA